MLNCPYCEKTFKGWGGLSAHIHRIHSTRWRGNLTSSLPPGFNAGKPGNGSVIPAVVKKGTKKTKIHSPCPFCDYTTGHPPGLARHIISQHPEKWKGSLLKTKQAAGIIPTTPAEIRDHERDSLGRKPKTLIELGGNRSEAARLRKKRMYQRKLRMRYILEGKTTGGKPRKIPLRGRYKSLEKRVTTLVESPEPRRRIEPIAFSGPVELPEEKEKEKPTTLLDRIVAEAAKRLVEQLMKQ